MAVLLFPFQFGFLCLIVLRLPILCCIKVAKVGIIVFFLISEEMLSALHH